MVVSQLKTNKTNPLEPSLSLGTPLYQSMLLYIESINMH